jgi:hypothetical protein
MALSNNADQIQFDELTKFEALRSQLNARILGFNRNYPPYTAAELAAFVSELQEWRKQLLTFDSVGQQLSGWGLPELSTRLTALLSDFDNAVRIFGEMQDSGVAHEKQLLNIQMGVNDDARRTIQEAQERQAKAMNDMLKKWEDLIR